MKNNIKNNWILVVLLTLIFLLLLSSNLLEYFYQDKFWNFIKEWQSIITPFFIVLSYLIFFILYIFYEKKWRQKKWKKKKTNEIKLLYENNKRDNFVDYDDFLNVINNQLSNFFNFQDSQKYSTNLLLINGKYGSGKTFIISNVLEKRKNQKNIYYIDLTTIENQSKNHFSKYLFNEIIKCVSYNEYLRKLFNLKFFKIFSKNLPFNFATEEIIIKNEEYNKVLIIIDEIDRCEPDNIIHTFTVLKNYCLNIKNVVFVVLLNEEVIKPIIQDYLKITKNHDEQYKSFLEKLTNNIIKIKNIFDFNVQKLDFLEKNKIIHSIKQTNTCLIKNLKSINQRNILRNITNKSLAQNIEIFSFLINELEINKKLSDNDSELFEFIQYLSLFKILISKSPEDIVDLKFKEEQFNTSFDFDYQNHLKFQRFSNINDNPIYKILPNKEISKINLSSEYDYSILSTDEKGNLYATTLSDSKILKINSEGQVSEFADFKNTNHVISLSIDENGNLYVATLNSSIILKINSEGEVSEFADFKNTNHVISLSIDENGNLYVATLNSSIILKINSEGQKSEIIDLSTNNINLSLATKCFNDNLFFIRNDNQFIYYANFNTKYIYRYWLIPEKVENSILCSNKKIGLCLLVNKNKLYYKFNNTTGLLNPQEIIQIDHKNIISMNIDNQNNLYFTKLNDSKYEINHQLKSNSYSYSLSKKLFTTLFNLPYYNYFVLKKDKFEEMNFLEFYFITKKNIKFNFIYIKNEFINEVEDFKKIFKESYKHLNLKQQNKIGIILEYKKNKYKIIFDLTEESLIHYEHYEDIWWKLSKIKDKNEILKNYDHFIHKIIVNLLNNQNWKKSHNELTKHLEKRKNQKIIGNTEFHSIDTTVSCEVDINNLRLDCEKQAKWRAQIIDETKNDIDIPSGFILLCNSHKKLLIDEKKVLAYKGKNKYFKL